MDPAIISFGLFVVLMVLAFWLTVPSPMWGSPSEIARDGLPAFKNPPPPPKKKQPEKDLIVVVIENQKPGRRIRRRPEADKPKGMSS